MVGWHHWLNGHESEQAPANGEGQRSLVTAVHGVVNIWTRLSDWTKHLKWYSRLFLIRSLHNHATSDLKLGVQWWQTICVLQILYLHCTQVCNILLFLTCLLNFYSFFKILFENNYFCDVLSKDLRENQLLLPLCSIASCICNYLESLLHKI